MGSLFPDLAGDGAKKNSRRVFAAASLCQRRAVVVADLAGCASAAGFCPPPKACVRSIAPPLQIESPIRFELREFPLILLGSVRLTWLATGQRKTAAAFLQLLSLCWRRAIFPGRRQPSIFGTDELNFRVRDGNG